MMNTNTRQPAENHNVSAYFDAIRIGLASPEKIREWSYGEVKKPETINYRSLKPERDGLFCERIFGPTKDWECHCGRYKRMHFKGVICDKCGVEVTKSKVRRERMGHIELAAPVSHIWYYKGIPCRMKMLLDMSLKDLEKVLYFAAFVVTDPGDTGLMYKQILSDKEYREAQAKFGAKAFKAGMGAESVKILLQNLDLDSLEKELRDEINNTTGQKRTNSIKRLEVVEAFIKSGNKPEWIILDAVPVIPPELRPMVQLDGGRFATSDLNDLYRRVINRNNRLKRLLELRAPEIIVRNEKRMLQEAVDSLIDNGKRGRPVTGPGNRPLKSLSDMLRGKQGRFRQNLLGKRVDYSGRSVIVVGPELKMYQCGLPKEMALELFKPFVMKKLVEMEHAKNIKGAKRMVERGEHEVWDVLEDVIKDHPVLLNRAPTLHRLGIQAFEPVLVEGRALKLHPLACTAYNADFDGDQMAVHVPLSVEAQAEARFLMLAANNILKPQDGKPVASPTQDMVLGCYYLTSQRPGAKGEGRAFSNEDEALMAYQIGEISLQALIKVRLEREWEGEKVREIVTTTVGRLIFNGAIPQDLGHYDRSKRENLFKLEIDHQVVKKDLGKIVDRCFRRYGPTKTSEVIDRIKALGFKYSTRGGITVGFQDINVPETKSKYITLAESRVLEIEDLFKNGLLTNDERKKNIITIWEAATKRVTIALTGAAGKEAFIADIHNIFDTVDAGSEAVKQINARLASYVERIGIASISKTLMGNDGYEDFVGEAENYIVAAEKAVRELEKTGADKNEKNAIVDNMLSKIMGEEFYDLKGSMDPFNPINMMADSGARGSTNQIRQLAGMRGLMADPSGQIIEVPIRSNFREGLTVLEFFVSSHGARKGLADTALRTADSGYLTRRLVDVSQDVIVREEDCFELKGEPVRGMPISDIKEGNKVIEPMGDRILGRYAVDDVIHPETGELLCPANEMITYERRDAIVNAGLTTVNCRSVFTCRTEHGICTKCYGANLTTGKIVDIGEAVGIVAAQAIGEPGTQLTMRTFHTGGVASAEDITQGLPRVEEIFEARKPKGLAVVTEISGKVTINDTKKKREATIVNDEGEAKTYLIPFGSQLKVKTGDVVEAGNELTVGSVNPHDILKIKGVKDVQAYMLKEVQNVYRLQGVEIADKHIEVIIRQMLRKVQIDSSGDTTMLPGELIDIFRFERENEQVYKNGGEPAIAKRKLLGITKASLATDSFLSAASFQETTRVLTEAAIKGKVDPLVGLKENVIIGKLIPAGIGMRRYRDVEVTSENTPEGSDLI